MFCPSTTKCNDLVSSLFEMSRLLHFWKTNRASRFPLTTLLEEDDILKSCCQATVIDCLSSSEQKRRRMCRSKEIKIVMISGMILNSRIDKKVQICSTGKQFFCTYLVQYSFIYVLKVYGNILYCFDSQLLKYRKI